MKYEVWRHMPSGARRKIIVRPPRPWRRHETWPIFIFRKLTERPAMFENPWMVALRLRRLAKVRRVINPKWRWRIGGY